MTKPSESAIKDLETAFAALIALEENQLEANQKAFWRDVYVRQVTKMGSLTGRFRNWGQVLRILGLTTGATVPPLVASGSALPLRIAAATVGVIAVVLNGAAAILRVDERVAVNRIYKAKLLAQGWRFVTGRPPYANFRSIPNRFEKFVDEVESLLIAYTREYTKFIDEPPQGGPGAR